MLFRTHNLIYGDFLKYKDINILEGKVTFIVGKSGSGKTTLFRLFNNTVSPSNGMVYYKENDINNIPSLSFRRDVLLVSQEVFLFDGTIKDNFLTFAKYREINEPPNDEEIKDYLNSVLLPFPPDKNVIDFSGGEKQRLFLAIMLSIPSKTIMLDEPTSALDSFTSQEVIKNIIEHCNLNGKNIFVISHSNELESKYSSQTIEL